MKRTLGVYQGHQAMTQDGVEIFPVETFLRRLWSGEFW